MPSNAFIVHLRQLLEDPEELDQAHFRLGTGFPGRQYGLASINRAMVVMSVSAWESYIEELMRECLTALHPPAGVAVGAWPALNAYVLGLIANFNTPDQGRVERIIRLSIGLVDVHLSWVWQNSTSAQAVQRLEDAMRFRHEIAHGVNPRPIVHHAYASQLPSFFRNLARHTDDAVRDHLVNVHGIGNPWPP